MSSTISKMTKETFGENEAIVIGDFAKNCQFLIHDEIQSYHWSKKYCKLYPLVVCYLRPDCSLKHDSLFFISDDNNHNTSFLYQVQTMLVDFLKANHPHTKKLI